ncbi:hypothetical protein ABB34_00395 [Stenotrophomonas daejeonensis]|uniref:Uncharacterized protein n=1 Tax=Stenotrophomonas daejeonensis TaxID=659018 RepID=A0A0R0E275_9GAMM|nr:tetratricopeptide repeat protein [Stenotrophomonas daejeonensis]KRG88299.1 hypothetical protein ABB34_00395 [Stenotrophomonas daejeonensis]
MSLIHDALRQSTATAGGSPSPLATASWPQQLAGYRRPVAWLAAGMLIAAPVAFLLARPHAGNRTTAASVVTVMPTTAVMPVPVAAEPIGMQQEPVLPAPVIASAPAPAPTPVPEATPEPDNTPAPVNTVSVPAMAAIANNVPTRDNTPSPTAQIQLSVRKLDSAGSRAATADENNAVAVRMAMSTLNAAVADHDAGTTANAIAQLQALLPAQSLTLLRARAWAAHGSGDYAEAERLYRTILDRVPDDEHAGVNLALLDARRGDVDDARARLDRMAARNSRSPQIAQALAELDAARQ